MNILVTGANGQLGNEMRILAKNSADNYVFTDVVDASEESIAMLKMLDGDDIKTDTEHLDISNEGVCSWFDFTKMIAEKAGNAGCDIQPCHSNEFPSPVKRPAYSVLDKTKIKNTFNFLIPYWLLSLEECIKKLGGSGLL